MKFRNNVVSNFKEYEKDTQKKILINICDSYQYGVTDTNEFYDRYYVKPKKCFKSKKLGEIDIIEILSYHLICNLYCVDWPKSETNMIPFKYKKFMLALNKLKNYILKNNIKLIISPVFGTEILEGDYKTIYSIIQNTFSDTDIEWVFIK